jgi:hypothetical protein
VAAALLWSSAVRDLGVENRNECLDLQGNQVAGWLSRHSVDILRVNLGLTFLGFGVLKFFPGASPAEALVMRTIDTLTLSIVSGRSAVC